MKEGEPRSDQEMCLPRVMDAIASITDEREKKVPKAIKKIVGRLWHFLQVPSRGVRIDLLEDPFDDCNEGILFLPSENRLSGVIVVNGNFIKNLNPIQQQEQIVMVASYANDLVKGKFDEWRSAELAIERAFFFRAAIHRG